MYTKIDQAYIENHLSQLTLELVSGEYKNIKSKLVIKCYCGNVFVSNFYSFRYQKISSCGYCNSGKIGEKYNHLTIEKVIPSKTGRGARIICKCDCGKIIGPMKSIHVINGSRKTCSHCNDPIAGSIYNSFTILAVKPSVSGGARVKCQCKCKKSIKWYNSYEIITGSIKSCGHCDDPSVGDKFGRLTITETIINYTKGCSVRCVCDCGNIISSITASTLKKRGSSNSCGHCNDAKVGQIFGQITITNVITCMRGGCKVEGVCSCGRNITLRPFSDIRKGNTTSCGNCFIHRKGRFTSQKALDLHDMVEQILGQKCEHNFHIKSIGSVDIVQPELKIAIEYDSYYWHKVNKDWTQRDVKKYKMLVKSGWRFLQIKSDGRSLPTIKQLTKALSDLLNGSHKRTITMKSWNEEKEYFSLTRQPGPVICNDGV